MNLQTRTDIDRAIEAACDMHDLRAGQTGTIRTPHQPSYDQPVDQPPMELTAEEDDRTVPALAADYWRRRAEWLPLKARWEPMHTVALNAAEAVIKVLASTTGIPPGCGSGALWRQSPTPPARRLPAGTTAPPRSA
ncbi:hypothetical protein Snov_4350 [Ancylobacter novellus DSM 506]|uniref:Uncharacterized protein n=1 Tax=Ancylobacter novellus (strain ATCC 8093 / DSM 506 / JCM 20403 / CCM 1077 / IAM 12100 / NBRC 12443 / NCIMB 10456) TaxID=639283 RepID=D6ZZB1_ANCN5|nr:hypothetical protein [Ancylobacter novellus]ADH89247.1 hypothetical protein Snov_1947 [Ancylobacter novellus DSM 506]ADH91609.1 hypothetical protein Snov_4350 [Ancylobacter novellus DSM 506]